MANGARGQAVPAPPRLTIITAPNRQIVVRWTDDGSGLILEQASTLGDIAAWQPVNQAPLSQDKQISVALDASSGQGFFRLRTPTLASITDSSPADGETGVAVTRETIVHFSQPLADTTVLKTNNFYATFGGRRILSRIELGTDRRKATLFYLEPLPGGARVNVFFDAEGLKDSLGRPLDPAGTGQANGFKLIQFDTLSLTPLAATAVIGRVFASELVPGSDTGANAVNKPLAGVTITVDGMEQTLRTTTDAQGNFTLSPVPPGRFFVHIDGRTVSDAATGIHYPDKSYYPSVGKAWDAVAGRTNNLAGGTGNIYLPLIKVGTLQSVSMARDTTISFPSNITADNPALAGVSITVPANSLFSDDGTRGGKVGIAPVPPDRLPGPLPPGLELPIVITVQTDGPLNFDRPAPVCFPNLPDPVLGTPLPAGSKQALISFNHKKGIWEAVGSMTVSADGKLICTDPGVGILQPGWHGVAPEPAEPPDCQDVCCPEEGEEEEEEQEGPSLASSMGRGDPGSGRVQKMKPKPPPAKCKKRKCKDRLFDYEFCMELCVRDVSNCEAHVIRSFVKCQVVLAKRPECEGEKLTEGKECKELLEFCNKIRDQSLKDCRERFLECWSDCDSECVLGPDFKPQSIAMAGPDPDLIADQIAERLDEIAALWRPYLSPESDIPTEVWTRTLALLAEADAIAGGDAGQFLDQHILGLEEERAAIEAEFGEEPGNAPPYPVLYAAEIVRGGDTLILRGETGPFGQYSLFVPRDGELLHVSFYDPRTKRIGNAFPRLRPGAPNRMRRFNLHAVDESFLDSDRDGLADVVEFVYGTDSIQADSDRDGIADGAEVEQGTNPLDGLAVQTGIIATAKTPGPAVDVWAGNDLVATAEGTGGVSLFNAYQGMNPTIIAHVSTPGTAQRVSGAGSFIAVATGQAGLSIIDISIPAEARISQQVPMTGAQALVAEAGKVYVGLASGDIAAVDLATGVVLDQLSITNALVDLAFAGDHLYALTDNRLFAIAVAEGNLALAGSAHSPSSPSSPTPNRRLFAGGGIAYTVHGRGYNTFDLADPSQPVLLTTGNTTQTGWMQIVPNGSGVGLAAVGPGGAPNGPRDVSLYDLSDPRTNDVFLTTFVTPGIARAVAIYNGLAYAADDTAGLQVINYLPYDAKGVPPTVALSTSFPAGGPVVESASVHVTVNGGDDVQVRHVEFYLDGVRVFTDGNFPFEYRFDAPALAPAKTQFTLRASAVDTGGNATWSAEMAVALLPDTTPARITATAPLGGAKTLSRIHAFFSEPMDPGSVNAASFQLISAGPDGLLETADDLLVGGGAVTYRADSKAAALELASPLPDGLYRAVVKSAVADLAGNRLAADYAWAFRVADAVFWTRNVDGLWQNPLNWSSGAVPGADDHVVIDAFGADVTVTYAIGTSRIKSLIANRRLQLRVGILQISEDIQLHQDLTLDGGSIQGGTVTQNGGAKLLFTNRSGMLDGVTVNGDLNLTNAGARLLIRNGLTLNGSVLLDNGAAIGFVGDQAFDTGSVVFGGNSGSLSVDGDTTLTLGPAMVVRGKSGFIGGGLFSGSGFPKLINRGLIATDVDGGALTIGTRQFENAGLIEARNGNALTFSSVNWSNTGRIEAASGAALTLNGAWSNSGTINLTEATLNLSGTFTLANLGTVNRTGGTVNLTGVLDLNGGTWTLDAASGSWVLKGGTIKGGTIMQSGAAKLIFTNNGGTLDAVSVNGDLDLTSIGARLLIRNGLTLTGAVMLNNGSALGFAGDQIFNTGSVVFAGDSGSLTIEGNTTLTLGPAMILRGKTGGIGRGAFIASGTGKLINQGLISADVAGGTLTLIANQFENTGTIAATAAGATIIIRANPFTNTGTIQELNGGKVLINP